MIYTISQTVPEMTIQGEAVKSLIETVKMMFGRGAPTEFDDQGFNKIDYNNSILRHLSSLPPDAFTPIKISEAVTAIQVLAKYKKTQLAGIWEVLYSRINQAISDIQGIQPGKTDPTKVLYKGRNKWGKDLYYIYGLSRQKFNIISRSIADQLSKLGRDSSKAWTFFYADKKQGLDIYQIDPLFVPFVKTSLDEYGYDTSEMKLADDVTFTADPRSTDAFVPPKAKDGPDSLGKYKIKKVDFSNGQLTIELGRWSTEWNKAITELKQNYDIGYVKVSHARIFRNPDKPLIQKLINSLKHEFQVNELEALLNQVPDENPPEKKPEAKTGYRTPLWVENIMAKTKDQWQLGISFLKKGTKEANHLLDIVKFIFPVINGNEGQRFIAVVPDTSNPYNPADAEDPDNPYKNGDKAPGFIKYLIRGDYNQYRQLSMVFKKYGFDTRSLNKIIAGLVSKNIVKPTRVEGDLDGYQKEIGFIDAAGNKRKTKVNDNEKFLKELETYHKKVIKDGREIDFELYDLQKNGIAFLYGRHSALLGDHTGTGKCKIGTSNVQTNLGNFEIQDIWNKFAKRISSVKKNEEWGDLYEDLYVHSINNDGKVVKGKINNLYREKFKGTLLKYTTSNGKETTVTKAHKFLTESGWKNNLSIGDYICSSANQFSIHKFNNTQRDLAYLIAWQIAEGCELNGDSSSYAKLSIAQNDKNVLEKLKNILKNLKLTKFNSHKNINPVIKSSKNTYELQLTSINYKKYLEKLGYVWGLKSKDKIIPEFIMNAADDVVKHFLQSFFDAEGYTGNRNRSIAITSASQKLIYQISLLLQRFNILCTYRKMMKCATNGTKIKRPYYELKIIGSGMDKFMKEIKFFYEYKNEKYFKFADVKHNYNKEGKPVYLALKPFFKKYKLPISLIGIKDKAYICGTKWMNNDSIEDVISKLKKFRNNKLINEYTELKRSKWTDSTTAVLERIKIKDVEECISSLNKLKNNDLQYEKIISVEEIDYNGYIYDLSIENTHNYISDNLICHNTIETIIAADMRMKENGGSTIIITLTIAHEQWANEIKTFAKHNPEDISMSPDELKTWTVLSYPMFQTIQTREATVKKLQEYVKSGKVTCLILDECHSVKNTGAARTKNIQDISCFTDEKTGKEYQVPFVWGASATVVANRPIDLYNQLKVINHPLGKLNFNVFVKEFGGMKSGRYGWEDAGIEEQIKAANKLKEWLINFGVYIARTKKDMREDLPELYVDEEVVDVDQVSLYKCVGSKVSGYKKPDLPVSIMMATRDCLALAKTPHSLQLAEPILKSGKKIIIFTAFKAAARYLELGLQRILDSIGNGGTVGMVIGGMHKKTRVENISDFKNPSGNIKAMVLMIQAGGTGLDFPNVVEDVIENDFDWTPASNEQMKGRAFRIVSRLPVKTKSVIARDTEDEDFKQRVNAKIEVAEIISKLTQEQLELFSLEEKEKTQSVKNRLDDIEQELIDAVKKQVELEEGEEHFTQDISDKIKNKIGFSARQDFANTNWYRKTCFGEKKWQKKWTKS